MNHNFYVIERAFKYSLNKYHFYINDPFQKNCKVSVHKFLLLNIYIEYFNKFIDQNPPITENSMMKSILTSLLNNADADIISLIIFVNEISSLMFKRNRSPNYLDDKIDY
jgi:hypothetical protein